MSRALNPQTERRPGSVTAGRGVGRLSSPAEQLCVLFRALGGTGTAPFSAEGLQAVQQKLCPASGVLLLRVDVTFAFSGQEELLIVSPTCCFRKEFLYTLQSHR